MSKVRLNLRLIVAIVICLASSATMFAQEETGVEINGVIWATRNVGMPGTFVANPEDAGMFYQWNRKVGWSTENPMIASDESTTWDGSYTTSARVWEAENNPCPVGWRVPTKDEIQLLIDAGFENINIGRGYRFGSGSNTIYLPNAGYRRYYDGELHNYTTQGFADGYYWSATWYALDVGGVFANSYRMHLRGGSINTALVGQTYHRTGNCVRCVKDASVGISNVSSTNVSVYPNPTVGMVYIETESNIKLYNLQGILIKETFGKQIDLSDYQQGLYLLEIDNKTVKVIKN